VRVDATAQGDANIRVGSWVGLTGINPFFQNDYTVTEAVHRFDNASGYLTDRFDSRWLLFAYYGLRGLSLLLLISLIPIVGGIVDALVLPFGLGALVITAARLDRGTTVAWRGGR